MRLSDSRSLLLLAGALLVLAPRAASAFDIDYEPPKELAKVVKIERTGPGEDFGDHVALYLRFIPLKGTRAFPVFINTHNYLTCPDEKDKKWLVNNIAEADLYKRTGVRLLAFFFDKPACDKPTYHMEAVLAES